MDQTVKIPMGLNEGPSQPAQEQPRPEWAKRSLHNVKFPRPQPEVAPEVPAANTSSPQGYDDLRQEIGNLTQVVGYLAQNQIGGGQAQQPSGPQPPDPTQFDFYEPSQAAEYQRLNNEFMQSMIQQGVQSALEPHRATLQDADLNRQYNSTLAQYGNDPNFQPIMNEALKLATQIAQNGGMINIKKAFETVRDQNPAPEPEVVRDPRSGRFVRRYEERSRHLPSGLRKINGLGQLMQYHQDKRSGRIS